MGEIGGAEVWKQGVLPETVADIGAGLEIYFSKKGLENLKKVDWHCSEVRAGGYGYNIYSRDLGVPTREAEVREKIDRLVDFVGTDWNKLPLSVLLNPESKLVGNVCGVYDRETGFALLKEVVGIFDLHELSHWIGEAYIDVQNSPPILVTEGFATWLAWQVMTGDEKKMNVADRYSEYSVSKREIGSVGLENENIDNDTARKRGAILMEVLAQKLGGPKTLLSEWKKVGVFVEVVPWIRSMGLDPLEVENEWKNELLKKKKK